MKVCQQDGMPNTPATARTRSAAGETQPGACSLASYRTPPTEEIEREREDNSQSCPPHDESLTILNISLAGFPWMRGPR